MASSSGSSVAIGEDASAAIARAAVQLRYEDLPLAAVATAKRSILDTLGVCMAATGAAPEVAAVRSFTEAASTPIGVPALGFGWPLPTLEAVFWVGALSHALDYDDYADIVHPSAPVVSAILPIAQSVPPVDGRTAIAAVALGQDVIIRIALALGRTVGDYGWLPSLPGAIGAALASSKVLGLGEEETRNAIGLALHLTHVQLLTVVVCAGLPTAQNTFVFAQEYGVGQVLANRGVAVTTTLSLATLAATVALLGR